MKAAAVLGIAECVACDGCDHVRLPILLKSSIPT